MSSSRRSSASSASYNVASKEFERIENKYVGDNNHSQSGDEINNNNNNDEGKGGGISDDNHSLHSHYSSSRSSSYHNNNNNNNNRLPSNKHFTIKHEDGPMETRVHFGRSGSVDITASPTRYHNNSSYINNSSSSYNNHDYSSSSSSYRNKLNKEYGNKSSLPMPPTPGNGDNTTKVPSSSSTSTHHEYIPRTSASSYFNHSSSYNKSGLGAGTQTSSKAVLSALRALQDKIRRLEQERSNALEESLRARKSVDRLELDMETQRRTLQAEHEEKQTAARLAYERLLSDKKISDEKLATVLEEKSSLLTDISSLQNQFSLEESKTREIDARASLFEERAKEAQNMAQQAKERERDLLQALSHEKDESRRQTNALDQKVDHDLREMRRQLEDERERRIDLETKKDKVDEFLLGVLAINEQLVQACTTSTNPAPTLKKKTLKKKPTSSTTTTTKKKIKKKKSISSSQIGPAGGNVNPMLNLPFLPTPQRHTFNILAGLSEAMKTTKSKDPKNVLSSLYNFLLHDHGANHSPHFKTSRSPAPRSKSPNRVRRCEPCVENSKSDSRFRSPAKFSNGRCIMEESEEDIENVIHSLEIELGDLNERYQQIMLKVKLNDGEDIQPLEAEDLKSIIQLIQRKDSQLQILKNSSKRLRATKSPLVSPASARRKANQLGALRSIHEADHLL